VLEDGRHVLYAGDGAERFALARGFTRVLSESMTTAAARERWASIAAGSATVTGRGPGETVGAVALDAQGTVAAATSTGGRTNKRVGRVGDSPIPGAGTYADDDAGACSATGDGEAVLRVCLAKSTIDVMRSRCHPEDAARMAIRAMGARVAGSGGVILVDRFGRLGLARNTATMPWAAEGEACEGVRSGA
jgi:beta-aspartyl-peptidase (threonine type)